ncbi:MAG: hypothetical protein U9O87_07030 [Verrucomicrobiota bacterium]|nr:hypothetical protein [Verrucomicrobiota bacterium]
MKKNINFSAIILILLLVLPFIMKFTALGEYFSNNKDALILIHTTGIDKPIPFLGMAFILLLLGVPRTILGFLAGSLFGFFHGLLLSLTPVFYCSMYNLFYSKNA